MRQNSPVPIVGLLFWLIFASTGRAQGGGTWQTRAPMPLSRQELATGILNGKLYVLGGYYLGFMSTATVQVYDPTTNTWTLAHPLPYVVNHNAAAVAAGNLYSFGAGAGETFVYNPNNNSWVARASSHYVHSRTAAVGVIDNKQVPRFIHNEAPRPEEMCVCAKTVVSALHGRDSADGGHDPIGADRS